LTHPLDDACLLSIAFLGHQRESHSVRWGRWGWIRLFVDGVDRSTLYLANWQRYVELRLSLEFAGVQAFCHHLLKSTIKVSFGFGIELFLRANDDNLLFFIRVQIGLIFTSIAIRCGLSPVS
jgi:hypothetical protein